MGREAIDGGLCWWLLFYTEGQKGLSVGGGEALGGRGKSGQGEVPWRGRLRFLMSVVEG